MRQKPYLAQSPMAVIYMHANAPIPLLPEELRKYQQLLNRLLAKDPGSIGSRRRARCWRRSRTAAHCNERPRRADAAALVRGRLRALARAAGRSRELREEGGVDGAQPDLRVCRGLPLTDRLSRLAREELRHFEQVQKMMQELGVPFMRLKPARYADGLRAATRRSDPGRLIDLLLCGALIEARSYERFVGLAPRLQAPLGEFYGGLAASEARHTRCICDWRSSAPVSRIGAHGSSTWRRSKRSWRRRPIRTARFHSGLPVRTGLKFNGWCNPAAGCRVASFANRPAG